MLTIGSLYEVGFKWLLPRSPARWHNCGLIVYLGEDYIEREDGVKITNHALLVDGERVIVDTHFLRLLREVK